MVRTEREEAIAAGLPDRMLTKQELLVLAKVSRTTAWKMIREGRLPQPVALGPNTFRWWYSEVVAALRLLTRGSRNSFRAGPALVEGPKS